MTDFVDVEMDVVPDLADVDNPCKKCGREIDVPYGGRGPRPRYCTNCKGGTAKRSASPRVGGKDANLAAQATGVLVQLNAMIAMGVAAVGMFRTGSSIAAANEGFEVAAYNALLTDPEFCKMILKGGAKSSKVSLALAYGAMGMAVMPTAVEEMRERKAERDAKKAANDADGG
jgi:hypothetical protein